MNYDLGKYSSSKPIYSPVMDGLIRKHRSEQGNVEGALFSISQEASGHFKVAWNRVIQFWKDYCELLQESPTLVNKNCLYEVNQHEATLRVLFRFVHSKKTPNIITERFLCMALAIVQETLQTFLEEDSVIVGIVCKYVGPALPGSDGNLREEIEFKFPRCRVSQSVYNDKILPEIKNRFRLHKLMSTLSTEPNGDWDQILQPMNTYFPLHGTKTNSETWSQAMKIYKCSDVINIPIDDGQTLEATECDIYDVFDQTDHSWLRTRASAQRAIVEQADPQLSFEPMIMSSFFSNEITTFHFIEEPVYEDIRSRSRYESDISSAEQTDMVQHLLPMISKERFRNNMHWLEIGRALYNVFEKDLDTGFELWVAHDINPHPREEYNREKWESFSEDAGVNDQLTHRTIASYARDDSPERYKEWHYAWMEESVKKSMSGVEDDVAEVLYRYFWLDFLTVGTNIWYKFKPGSTRLIRMMNPSQFIKEFGLVRDHYRSLLNTNVKESINITDKGKMKTKTEKEDDSKIILKIIAKLGTTTFQNAMIKQCAIKFYREDIEPLFDSNPNLISWTNVVSCVHESGIYVRPGKMEDFITKTTGVRLELKSYSWDHPLVKEIMEWFRKVFPVDSNGSDDLLQYFLKICASFLYGRNAEKYLYAFAGKSNAGKSQIIKLFAKVLGLGTGYWATFPNQILTGEKKDSSGPSPELAQAKGARGGVCAELDAGVPIRSGKVKALTGGDGFYARNNHENGGTIEAMFKLIMMCNQIPQIEGADPAVVNRFRYLPFLTVFSKDAPEDPEEQRRLRVYPMDEFFDAKLDSFKKPMAWIMFQYFPKYRKEGLRSPAIVEEYTRKHWEDNDPYNMFIKEMLVREPEGSETTLNSLAVYNRFKPWYRGNFPTSLPIDKRTMVAQLTEGIRLGPLVDHQWVGWRLKVIDDGNVQRPYGGSSGAAGGAKKGSGIA